VSEQRRLDLTALGVGFLAEAAIFTIIYFAESAGTAIALLFYLEAIVLGWVFGARAGTLAAAVPFATIALVDIAFFETQRTQLVVATLFVVLTLGFTAWLVGSLRDRYSRRPVGGPNGRRRLDG
jgi:hypothetical protein